jgi:hypothetical protein
LLEEVVSIRRWEERTGPESRVVRWDVRSEMVEVDGSGMQRVEGRPRPGKEVRRMLIVEGCDCAMLGVDVVLADLSVF